MNDFYPPDHFEGGQMIVVGRSNSPSQQSADHFHDNDVILRRDQSETKSDRMYDPPSKVCGGAVFSKLMSLGNKKNERKSSKKKTQHHQHLVDHLASPTGTSMAVQRTTISDEQNNNRLPCHSVKQIVPTATTMSSMSSSISSHYHSPNYSPNGIETMPSLQEIHAILSEMKYINNKMAKEVSGSDNSQGARDAHETETIEKLKEERTFYKSEANALRTEMGGIKEELSELRKFLQDFSVGKNIVDGRQSFVDQADNKKTLQEKVSTTNMNGNTNLFPNPFPTEQNFFASDDTANSDPSSRSRKQGNQDRVKKFPSGYYKHDDLFSSLDESEHEEEDEIQKENQCAVEHPIPTYPSSKSNNFLTENQGLTRGSETYKKGHKDSLSRGAETLSLGHHRAASLGSSAIRGSTTVGNVSSRTTLGATQFGKEFKRETIVPPPPPPPPPPIKETIDASKFAGNISTSASQNSSTRAQNLRRFRGRSLSPMRRHAKSFFPRSAENSDTASADNDASKHYRRPDSRLSNENSILETASLHSHSAVMASENNTLHEQGNSMRHFEARDDIDTGSNRSSASERRDDCETRSERSTRSKYDESRGKDLAEAKNFYRSFRPASMRNAQSLDYDMKAADRKYREMQRQSRDQPEPNGSYNQTTLKDPENYLVELRRKPTRSQSLRSESKNSSTWAPPTEDSGHMNPAFHRSPRGPFQ